MRTGLNGDGTIFKARRFTPPPDVGSTTPAERGAPTVRFKCLDEFLNEYEPLSYALEPIIRTSSLYSLTAKTGAGKTAWMISAALAVATGRSDILGIEVPLGRVAFMTFENPDDVRMRLKISAYLFGIEIRSIADRLLILDMRATPEAVLAELQVAAVTSPVSIAFVDTLAAMFDGADINNAVEAGNFLRRLRTITKIAGSPAVVVAAHPVKNAQPDQLVPYGSGAILNEVDGNLTLWRKESGTVELHWQGKLRGVEFQPAQFRFEITTSPEVRDTKGREIGLPTMLPAKLSESDVEAKAKAAADVNRALLRALAAHPKASQRVLAEAIGRSPSVVNQKLQRLKDEKLVDKVLDRWQLTAKGKKELAA